MIAIYLLSVINLLDFYFRENEKMLVFLKKKNFNQKVKMRLNFTEIFFRNNN